MMTPKSLAYMVVAVFVGYILVSAVPGQVAMYATPTLAGEGAEMVTVTGRGFSPENETLSSEIDDLSESTGDSVESDELQDLAESASEAVEAVAATAGSASETDAAEAAKAARDARSGLEFMGTMAWLIVNMFVALVVYWFARRRFA